MTCLRSSVALDARTRKHIAAGIVAAWLKAAAMPWWAEDMAGGDDRALDALEFHRLIGLVTPIRHGRANVHRITAYVFSLLSAVRSLHERVCCSIY
ncbi:MAG TPA: hypothetical protein VFV82_04525 [Candidatus Binatia bacterium]|nr:hypothetical protein [Candidatus Binatia bacterium]